MKLRSKNLYLLSPFIVIVNMTALYLWQVLGWSKPTLLFTVFGVMTIAFFFVMNRFYESLEGNKRFIAIGAIFGVGCGTYVLIASDMPLIGLSLMLAGLAVLASSFLTGAVRKVLMIAAMVGSFAALALAVLKPDMRLFSHTADQSKPVAKREVVTQKKKGLKDRRFADIIKSRMTPDQLNDPELQKMLAVMESDTFQTKLDEYKPKTIDEFINFLESEGYADLFGSDLRSALTVGYQRELQDYLAANDGKPPQVDDDLMANRVVAAIEKSGLMGGAAQFMQDRENLQWVNARFQGDHAAFSVWWAETRSLYESRNFQTPLLPSDPEPEPLASSITENETTDTRPAEPSQPARNQETERIPPVVVEPERVVTKPSPKRLSPSNSTNPVPFTPPKESQAVDQFDPDELIRQLKQLDRVLTEGEQPERQPTPREQEGGSDR